METLSRTLRELLQSANTGAEIPSAAAGGAKTTAHEGTNTQKLIELSAASLGTEQE